MLNLETVIFIKSLIPVRLTMRVGGYSASGWRSWFQWRSTEMAPKALGGSGIQPCIPSNHFKYFLTYIFHVVRLRGGSDVEGGTPLEIIKVS